MNATPTENSELMTNGDIAQYIQRLISDEDSET